MLHWFFLSSSFFWGGTLFGSVGEKHLKQTHLNSDSIAEKNPTGAKFGVVFVRICWWFYSIQELNITKCGFPVDGPLKVTIWMFHFASSFKDSLMMFQFDSSPLTRHSRTHPIWCFSGVWLGSEWMDISMKISIVFQFVTKHGRSRNFLVTQLKTAIWWAIDSGESLLY